MKPLVSIAVLAGAASSLSGKEAPAPSVVSAVAALAPLPDAFGFAGMFAGVSGHALLCAGGANFPDQPLAQGGKKVWHDQVFVLAGPDGVWRVSGRLPQANGYGVSATWRDAVVLVGGGNAQANFRDCHLMRWDGTRLTFLPLPPLPVATANACGALVDDTLIVAGGQETPTATTALARCFALDLAASNHTWRELPWPAGPSGRILAVAAAHDGWFYLFSGAALFANATGGADRRYLTDAWRYRVGAGWQRLADLPHAVVAAPSPAMKAETNRLVIAGGVWPEFLAALPKNAPHPGFSRELLAYDVTANRWTNVAAAAAPMPAPPRVTAPLAAWHGQFVVPSGEVAPGIRTPSVLAYQFAS